MKPLLEGFSHQNIVGIAKIVALWMIYNKELILGGGRLRELILLKLLEQYYRRKFRRDWLLSTDLPHISSHRKNFFDLGFGKNDAGPYLFYRGFLTSEIIQDGDRLLDIGCGDGFLTKRFYSKKCAHIDAIDAEPSAIESAMYYNNSPNIMYSLQDAVAKPFPYSKYNVIVLDGALGHFPPEKTYVLLEKICNSLEEDGLFVGSESLGIEGSDHLQFFNSLRDLYLIFKPFFEHIQLRCVRYTINEDSFNRREAFWRCSNNLVRIEKCSWKEYSETK